MSARWRRSSASRWVRPTPTSCASDTGFVIGGVPPVAHAEELPTYIDEDLLQYREIWAAAGTPHAVFRLTPDALLALTGGQVAALKE